MKNLFICLFLLLPISLFSQDLGIIGTDLNQLLIEKEIYQTQVSFPETPYTIKMEVPDSYFKEFDIRKVTISVRKGTKNALTGNLYEVYLASKIANNPCILVNIGEEQYMDIHAHLLFENEEDAQRAGEYLKALQKITEW